MFSQKKPHFNDYMIIINDYKYETVQSNKIQTVPR